MEERKERETAGSVSRSGSSYNINDNKSNHSPLATEPNAIENSPVIKSTDFDPKGAATTRHMNSKRVSFGLGVGDADTRESI